MKFELTKAALLATLLAMTPAAVLASAQTDSSVSDTSANSPQPAAAAPAPVHHSMSDSTRANIKAGKPPATPTTSASGMSTTNTNSTGNDGTTVKR